MHKQVLFYLSFLVTLGLVASLSGCVTARRYDAALARLRAAESSRTQGDAEVAKAMNDAKTLRTQIDSLRNENRKLIQDSTQVGQTYRRNKTVLDDLLNKYELLDKSYNQLLTNSGTEKGYLSQNLSKKEQELRDMEQNILAAKAQNDKLGGDLKSREQRVAELEKVLADKDKAVNDLKTAVNNALLSFKGSDLSVDVRNGKVYVSLSEKLLFKSGSYAVDAKGAEALKKLAAVLKTQPDINVLVEGHTDDVPIAKGNSGVDDNWDLSVLRATSIVNILQAAGAPPVKLTAAGRGEHLPVDPAKTAEARQKNRRTEIILTPKLDELFKVLGAE
ncbi:MAG: OmpA family protein [Ferruginibacter sp.]|nr:OmpA family protein [Cytophagales bacterium]